MWSILFADSKKVDELRSPEQDIQLERRMRKKRDDYGDGDKHQDDVGDGYDRHLSSRDDIAKDGKKKDKQFFHINTTLCCCPFPFPAPLLKLLSSALMPF
jgi:hypothetical protein